MQGPRQGLRYTKQVSMCFICPQVSVAASASVTAPSAFKVPPIHREAKESEDGSPMRSDIPRKKPQEISPIRPTEPLEGGERHTVDGGKRTSGSGGGVTASSGRGVHGRHQGAVGTAEKKVPTADVESQVTDSISHRLSDSAVRSTPASSGVVGGVSTPPLVVIKSAAAAVLHGASIVAGGGEEPTPRSAAAMSRATEELQHTLRHNIDSVHNVMTALFLASTALMISPKFLMLHVRTLAIGTAVVMSLKTALVAGTVSWFG